MTLTTPAHFERIYSHVSFHLHGSKQSVSEAKGFWPEIIWLASQLRAGQSAPSEVRDEVNRWHNTVRNIQLVTESPDKETAAHFQKQCITSIYRAEKFLDTSDAINTTELWVRKRQGILANLFKLLKIRNLQTALLGDELYEQLLSMFDRVNCVEVPAGYQLKQDSGAKFRVFESSVKVATRSSIPPQTASTKMENSKLSSAMQPTYETHERTAPPNSTRQKWEYQQRSRTGGAGFRAPFSKEDIASIANSKPKKVEKETTWLTLRLKELESRRNTLKRHFTIASRKDLPAARKRQASLLENLNAFLSANSRLLTSEEREQIRSLRISIQKLRPPNPTKVRSSSF